MRFTKIGGAKYSLPRLDGLQIRGANHTLTRHSVAGAAVLYSKVAVHRQNSSSRSVVFAHAASYLVVIAISASQKENSLPVDKGKKCRAGSFFVVVSFHPTKQNFFRINENLSGYLNYKTQL